MPENIIKKLKLLPRSRFQSGLDPYMIVLHDTAGPTLRGAEDTLRYRGLGYHFMIDKSGQVYQYAHVHEQMSHALGFNAGTVSISFVGGYKYGEMNEAQIHACVDLINSYIKPEAGDSLKFITGHKHASKQGKVDPRWPGEPPEGINLAIDRKYMTDIAEATGLIFKTKFS